MSRIKTKAASQSLTIQASALALAASLLPLFGVKIAPDAMPALEQVIAGIAAAIAIYGRVRANTLIENV